MAHRGPKAQAPGSVTIDTAQTVADLRELFHRQESHSQQLNQMIADLRNRFAKNELAQTKANADRSAASQQPERIDSIDLKALAPTRFDGSKTGDFRPRSQRMKAFCNAKKCGVREAFEMSERTKKTNDEERRPGDRYLLELVRR